MILNIAKHESERGVEGGVYYFNLHDYPHISENELKIVIAFIRYEASHNRQTKIVCDAAQIITTVENAVAYPNTVKPFILSDTTEFVYHATDLRAAQKILSSGELLSATNVYGRTGEELAYEKKDSPWNDPSDYFEYIMFCNGDDMTGDFVVLSESFPNEDELEKGCFNAGVRFYIRSKDIIQNPGYMFDGYHPAKVKDRIVLAEYLYACIVPEQYRVELYDSGLPELAVKVHYLPQKGMCLSEWNSDVYKYIRQFSH